MARTKDDADDTVTRKDDRRHDAGRFDVAARSTVLYAVQGRWPHHGLRVSTPLCPERT